MNRGQAERAVAESDLSMAETLAMMMLLRRADNDTLIVPDWRTPTMPQLAAEVRVSLSTLRRLLAHLELHGWQKRVTGRGRGRKSSYSVLPDKAIPPLCECRKGVTRRHPLPDVKGVTETASFTGVKGVRETSEKVSNAYAEPQVTPDIAPRAPRGKVVEGDRSHCTCGAPISPLRYAQAGSLCVRCESAA